MTSGVATAKGASNLASAASSVEKVAGKVANVATAVEAGAKAANGDVQGAVTAVAAAGIDRGVGVAAAVVVVAIPGGAPVAPYVGAVASTLSATTDFGNHVAGPAIDGIANAPTNVASSIAHEIEFNLCPVGCSQRN